MKTFDLFFFFKIYIIMIYCFYPKNMFYFMKFTEIIVYIALNTYYISGIKYWYWVPREYIVQINQIIWSSIPHDLVYYTNNSRNKLN